MPRIRKSHAANFTTIGNALIQNKALSWKARGIMIYLLSMPEDWEFNLSDLANRAPDGKAALRTGIDELKALGYIDIVRDRAEAGTFDGWTWYVYEQPKADNRNSDNPNSDNRTLQKKHGTKETSNKKIPPQTPEPSGSDLPIQAIELVEISELAEGSEECTNCGAAIVYGALARAHGTCPACARPVQIKDPEGKTIIFPPQKARRRAKEKSHDGPAPAFYGKPTIAFCGLVSMDVSALGSTKRAQWARQIQDIAEEAGADAYQTANAIMDIAKSEYAWMTFTSPYQTSFANTLTIMLGRQKGSTRETADPESFGAKAAGALLARARGNSADA
jgi:hypothetical protein